MSWKGIKDFLGITSQHSKSALIKLPRCFGVYRSKQADAENCCAECIRNAACFREFNERAARHKEKAERQVPPPEPAVSQDTLKPKTSPVIRCDAEKEFLKIFRNLTYQHSPWEVWRDFVVMFACALSNPVDKSHYDERESLYMKTIKKYNKQEQALYPELTAYTVMALEHNQEQDFLGNIFMKLNLGNNAKAQIFTPYHVCELMAKIATDDVVRHVEEHGYLTIHDPCCGAGATLIAGIHEARKQLEKVGLNWQNHVLVAAQDIDETVALMCYIQLSLLGAAAYIKVGNSLTEPTTTGDTLENYWFTMMYFSDVWSTRRILKKMSSLFEEEKK